MTASIRYIRSTLSGNSINNGNHWSEIRAIDPGAVNAALNKTVTGNFTPTVGTLALVTDGNNATASFVEAPAGTFAVTVDLGAATNIDTIQLFHPVGDNRFYHEVVEVALNVAGPWSKIFDSVVNGGVTSTTAGQSITVPSVAGAPTNAVASITGNSISVAFTAPVSNGGSAITGYEVTLSTGQIGTGAASPIAVAATAGVATTATVKAINAIGASAASVASNSVTIAAPPAGSTVPNAPTNLVATAGDASASVAFTAPASNGGAPITSYKVTASTGQFATGAASPIVVTVANGVAVTFTATAFNGNGESSPSSPSNSVVPARVGDSTVVQGGLTILTRGIGTGRTYADLAAFGAYIRGLDLVTLNQRVIGELYNSMPLEGNLHTLNCDETRNVLIRPAAGQGMTGYTYNGTGITLSGSCNMGYGVTLQGVHISIAAAQRILFWQQGNGPHVPTISQCRILADGVGAFTTNAYQNPMIEDSLLVRRAANGGVMFDTGGWRVNARRCTFAVEGTGTLLKVTDNRWGSLINDCVFHNIDLPYVEINGSTNNFTNKSTAAAGGLTVETVAAFFTNPGVDYRPATFLLGKASLAAISQPDNTGGNRGLTPDPGAFQLTPAAPLPRGVVTVQTLDGASLTLSGTTTNTPVTGKVTLSPGTPANGASAVGPLDLVIAPGVFSITINDLIPGNYLVTATLSNGGGIGSIDGAAAFDVSGVGNLVYDGGGVGGAVSATTLVLSGVSSGTVNAAQFMTVGTDNPLTGSQSQTVTLSSPNGTFAPATVTLSFANPSVSSQYTPTLAGAHTLTASATGTPVISSATKSFTANAIVVTPPPPPPVRTVTLTLKNRAGTPRSLLTGLRWAFFEASTPDLLAAPSSQGIGETTDLTGVLTISVQTKLAAGATGWLVVSDSNGDPATASNAFSAPVAVS